MQFGGFGGFGGSAALIISANKRNENYFNLLFIYRSSQNTTIQLNLHTAHITGI